MTIINKLIHVKNWLLKRFLALIVMGILSVTTAICQLPTATQVASQMKVGWNLGNTLEAICAEDAWSNPLTTQTLINSIKAAGFNTIRIPCAWDCHTTNGVIDATWIARVKEVVDYCINNNMYVIINIHWDGGWLENNITRQKQSSVIAKQQNYWTQIANYFKAYDEHLLFAGSNEPNAEDAAAMEILLSYHQAFIDAVRATGGNNSSRTLIVQGPSTDIEKTNTLMNTMPTDQIANRLMVEVHYYTPYQFCLMEEDASWGSMAYYWGNGYHSSIEPSRNATWGEESDIEYYFGLMKTKFVDNGIPVILGEFAAMKRTTPADLSLHLASRAYYHKYIVSSAIAKGLIPYYWDHGQFAFALFNRSTGAVVDQQNLDAIMQGAGGGSTNVSVTGVTLSPSTAAISVGGTSQLTATVAPSNATNKTVSWSSTNTSVATVSSSGLVTGVSEGSATITVTTQDGSFTASCNVTVAVVTNYTIVVRALGSSGKETIQLKVGNTLVNSWTLKRSMVDYSATTNLSGEIKVEYTNDGSRKDARIDYIVVNGTTYQAEDQAVNTGVYQNNQCGGSYSEWLNCNGYIIFSSLKSAPVANIDKGDSPNDLKIYPNPAIQGQFKVEAKEGSLLTIIDMEGRVVFRKLLEGPFTEINSDLCKGLYLLKIANSEYTIIRKLGVK
jgi:aryl-phospho-beta-D-glucosidase BglC (GH1 family)